MEAKAEEFHNIKMGKDRVTEYTTHFTNLLCYAPYYVVNSKKEKLYYYRKGLNPHIKLKFGGIESNTLRALVIAASRLRRTVLKLERSTGRGSVSLRSPSVAMIARGSTDVTP